MLFSTGEKMSPITPDEKSNPRAKRVLSHSLSLAVFTLLLLTTAIAGLAQSATVSGSLSNFDVINNTGHDAHGFEIELEGLQPADVYYTFNIQRYGNPSITQSATG